MDDMMKSGFGTFFIVRVEDMLRVIKLPVPPSRATSHSLIYITSGEAIMSIGSDTYKIFKGQCFIVPAGQVFSFRHRDVNKGYLCNFHDDSVVGKFGKNTLLRDFEFLKPWANPCITLSTDTSKHVEQLFKRILRAYGQHGLTNPDIIQSNFIALLCELKEAYKAVATNAQTHAVVLTNRFRELLFKNLRTHHRVSDYATFLHISPNHLNKTVKAVTGKSPTKWIDEAIVLEAKVLLHQSDLSIAAVAEDVGFLDPSYFSRLFKKYEDSHRWLFASGLKRPEKGRGHPNPAFRSFLPLRSLLSYVFVCHLFSFTVPLAGVDQFALCHRPRGPRYGEAPILHGARQCRPPLDGHRSACSIDGWILFVLYQSIHEGAICRVETCAGADRWYFLFCRAHRRHVLRGGADHHRLGVGQAKNKRCRKIQDHAGLVFHSPRRYIAGHSMALFTVGVPTFNSTFLTTL